MKHIFLNLKRFDVPREMGGVNSLAPIEQWGKYIVEQIQKGIYAYQGCEVEFVHFFPEAHLISAVSALNEDSNLKIGSQGVFREDTSVGGNFGAFTTNRTANAVAAIGCSYTIIGHCEERNDKAGILKEAGVADNMAVQRILNKEIACAQKAGLSVLYCIGEKEEELGRWQEVLAEQLDAGLSGIDKSRVVIGYEPVWSIGPGKTPADKSYIEKAAHFIKQHTGGMDVVYGGGLKADNAKMLAEIDDIDGGLIALTRFTGEIGFYPEEYLEIVELYLGK